SCYAITGEEAKQCSLHATSANKPNQLCSVWIGGSEGQECDPPHIAQGSNELHIVQRLGTRRSSFTSSPASSSSAGLSSYPDFG
ncbi:hypothetical protein JOQ06_019811, partial [Pogonophryne albipinna]